MLLLLMNSERHDPRGTWMDTALILPSNTQEELALSLQASFLGVYLNDISH